ncbi:hypothetical protein NE237_017723 [Protea cynaroides]|uniref:Uncharacterized protein n=1 Tax=Protea cynaroides TaxID=273540 RepID=A0A9Q0K8K6_9MAGN|nr:hypothetical protein NE237_017723 [Protea cynaroides]
MEDNGIVLRPMVPEVWRRAANPSSWSTQGSQGPSLFRTSGKRGCRSALGSVFGIHIICILTPLPCDFGYTREIPNGRINYKTKPNARGRFRFVLLVEPFLLFVLAKTLHTLISICLKLSGISEGRSVLSGAKPRL